MLTTHVPIQALQVFDSAQLSTFLRVTRLSFLEPIINNNNDIKARIFLPIRYGGAGLRLAQQHHSAAVVGSLTRNKESINTIFQDEARIVQENERYIQSAIDLFETTLGVDNLDREQLEKEQKAMSERISKTTYQNLLGRQPSAKIMQCANGSGFSMLPGQYDIAMLSDEDFSGAMTVYLGLDRIIPRTHIVNHVDHTNHENQHDASILSCGRCCELTQRHNQVVDYLHFAAKANRIDSIKNPRQYMFAIQHQGHEELLQPFDLHTQVAQGNAGNHRVIGYDVTVIDPIHCGIYRNSTVEQAYINKAREKTTKYAAVIQRHNAQGGIQLQFHPLVFSAYGAASKSALEAIERLFDQTKNKKVMSIVLRKISLRILVHSGRAVRKYFGRGFGLPLAVV